MFFCFVVVFLLAALPVSGHGWCRKLFVITDDGETLKSVELRRGGKADYIEWGPFSSGQATSLTVLNGNLLALIEGVIYEIVLESTNDGMYNFTEVEILDTGIDGLTGLASYRCGGYNRRPTEILYSTDDSNLVKISITDNTTEVVGDTGINGTIDLVRGRRGLYGTDGDNIFRIWTEDAWTDDLGAIKDRDDEKVEISGFIGSRWGLTAVQGTDDSPLLWIRPRRPNYRARPVPTAYTVLDETELDNPIGGVMFCPR